MTKETKANREARLGQEFTTHYGDQHDRLQGWQDLCTDVGINPAETITKCKKALKTLHINIVELLQAKKAGRLPRLFHSHQELVKWTLRDRKKRIFPLAAAKTNGFLTSLLENMRV